MTDSTERQAKSRQSRTKAGGKQIAVMLDAEARVKLEAWVAKGFSIAQTVNRLLGKNVDVIIGAASSGVTLSTLDLVTSNGVLQISPANTSPELTTAPDSGLYWRTAPSDVLQGAFVGSLVLQDGYTKVAIMSLQDSYGDGLNANVTKAITEGGGEIVANVVYDPKSADFSADVAKIKAAGPEAIVLIGFDESAQIITELVKQGIGPNVS